MTHGHFTESDLSFPYVCTSNEEDIASIQQLRGLVTRFASTQITHVYQHNCEHNKCSQPPQISNAHLITQQATNLSAIINELRWQLVLSRSTHTQTNCGHELARFNNQLKGSTNVTLKVKPDLACESLSPDSCLISIADPYTLQFANLRPNRCYFPGSITLDMRNPLNQTQQQLYRSRYDQMLIFGAMTTLSALLNGARKWNLVRQIQLVLRRGLNCLRPLPIRFRVRQANSICQFGRISSGMFAGRFGRSFAVVAGLLESGGGVEERRGVCTGGVSSCGGSGSRLVVRLAMVPYPLLLPFGTMLQCFRRRRFKLSAPVISADACCFRFVLGAGGHQPRSVLLQHCSLVWRWQAGVPVLAQICGAFSATSIVPGPTCSPLCVCTFGEVAYWSAR